MLDCMYAKTSEMAKRKKPEPWAPTGFEEWGGYMAAKKLKLQEQFQETADKEFKTTSTIFQGICIFVNGYTKPSSDELRLLMMQHNGVFHYYMRSQITTHIIASNLPYSKIMMHKKSQNPLPICKPEWITDSIKAGRLLDYQKYLLYSNHTKTQPKLAFATPSAGTSTSTDRETITDSPSEKESSVQESLENLKSSTIAEKKSPLKGPPDKSVNSTKNPEFLSEFYNNSRLHHISTMGAVFKDYINELRDKSDKKFPGLERLKEVHKLKTLPSSTRHDDSDSEEEMTSSMPSVLPSVEQGAVIMHIDMDCFFVSVGLRNRPELKGFPVAVTHAKGNKNPQNSSSREAELRLYKEKLRQKLEKTHKGSDNVDISTRIDKLDDNSSMSEIASCSYEARKAGIKNGMFLGQALKLCPNLKTIKYDFEGYKEVSYMLYDTVAAYTLDIEAVSCDEMYANCTKIIAETGLKPLEFAEVIRREIKEKTGCPVSTGFGQNKLQARLATRKAKPDGQFHLTGENVQRYMSTMHIRDLPGIGTTMTYKLSRMGVHTCAEMQSVSQAELQREFGKKTGIMLYNMCRGIDNSKLSLEHVRKSVSAEVNYGIRFESMNDAVDFLTKLSEEVSSRLDKANAKGRCITLKLMIRSKNAPQETAKYMGHGVCDHFTRLKNLIASVNDASIIKKEVLNLWQQSQQIPTDIRGVGIQISRLESTKKSSTSGSIMSFIAKTKQKDAEAEPTLKTNEKTTTLTTIGIEKKLKTTKPKGLNGYFSTTKSIAPVADVARNSVPVDVGPTPPDESDIDSLPCIETTKLNEIPATVEDNQEEYSGEQPIDNSKLTVAENESEPSKIESPALDIDESVLAELPEDIRNEIISATRKNPGVGIKTKVEKVAMRQRTQESYFKESKANVERSKKSEMPPIKEVDFAFLLELPDDIRNEIFNEYRTQINDSNQNSAAGTSTTAANKVSASEPCDTIDEANLSISQVDPDFLAALPDDVLKEVKNYCATKKIENQSKTRQVIGQRLENVKQIQFAPNKSKANRAVAQPGKSKSTSVRTLKNTNGTKNKKNTVAPKNVKMFRETNVPETHQRNMAESNERNETNHQEMNDLDQDKQSDKTDDNLMKVSTDTEQPSSTNPQKDILKHLVEELTYLPLTEVKTQMQNWISESVPVNEVDFLAFTTFLSTMPKKRRIEDLHVLLKTMHRCVTKTKECSWHEAYRKTVEHVQHHMLAVYDSGLMVPSIECECVKCKNVRIF